MVDSREERFVAEQRIRSWYKRNCAYTLPGAKSIALVSIGRPALQCSMPEWGKGNGD